MKKVLLALAFTGLLAGTAFAGEGTKGDDKDKAKAKKECCKKDGDAKACAGEKKETCAKERNLVAKRKLKEQLQLQLLIQKQQSNLKNNTV